MLHDVYVEHDYSSVCTDCGLVQTMGGFSLPPSMVDRSIVSVLVLQGRISDSEIFQNQCSNCPSEESIGHESYELVKDSDV